MDAVQRWLTLLTLVSAALAGLLYVSRQVWRGFRLVERLADIVQHELSPNSGTSMKDDVAAIAVAVGQVQADVSQLQTDVEQLTESKDSAHELLQIQLDSISGELGNTHGQHKAATHKRERDST